MYELVKLGEKTYFVDCPTRIGIYKINSTDVCLIDSGNSPDAAKKVLNICAENEWRITHIINTHAHADHIGGNALIQKRTNCKILCAGIDLALVNNPTLNNSYTYGGLPPKELCNKFMLADKSVAGELCDGNIPDGLHFERFDGHSFSQVAVFCDDGTCFTGDILCGEDTIKKYHIFFLRDPGLYIESVERLCKKSASVFCASHYAPIRDTSELLRLAKLNIDKITELSSSIFEICKPGRIFEDVLALLLEKYGLVLSFNQYAIAGSTVRSFLSYLHDNGKIEAFVSENHLVWKSADLRPYDERNGSVNERI